MDGELREYSNAHVQVRNEINALESAAHNLSLQSASLSELRACVGEVHLGWCAIMMQCCIAHFATLVGVQS